MDQDGRVVEAGESGLVDAEDVRIEVERDAFAEDVARAGALDDDARTAVGERRHRADGRRNGAAEMSLGVIAAAAGADDPELLRPGAEDPAGSHGCRLAQRPRRRRANGRRQRTLDLRDRRRKAGDLEQDPAARFAEPAAPLAGGAVAAALR